MVVAGFVTMRCHQFYSQKFSWLDTGKLSEYYEMGRAIEGEFILVNLPTVQSRDFWTLGGVVHP